MTLRNLILACACVIFAACSGSFNPQAQTQPQVLPPGQTAPQTDPAAASPPITAQSLLTPHISHVTLVIMENYDYEQLIGNSAAPYLNSLARNNALFTRSYAIGHPSQPNYLALFSGSTHGITSDACPVTFSTANLATELMARGYTFAGYAENWPTSGNPCYGTYSTSVNSHYLYWRKHAPWTDFSNLAYRTYGHAYIGTSTPLGASVNFIVPNICHDMHDCGIAAADYWLAHNIPAIQAYDNTHNGLLIVTFDEGDVSPTNHIVTIASGPMVARGYYSQFINHYSVLRFIESNFGLPLLGSSATAATMPTTAVP